ncbi:MAG: deoxyribonuclease IV [Candidatus Peregrinibacteria bacterium]|nr:deoxyribonuclease IV [Candidatus Peregrinibacteria bacterium]
MKTRDTSSKTSVKALLGCHVSAAGGFYKAIENAEALGATCIQFFGASPRQWFTKMPTEDDVKKYKDHLKKSSVKAVYLHAAYLANLASPNAETYQKSITNLSEHLTIATMIGANGLIFHMGSGGKEITREEAIQKIISGMKEVLKNVPGTTQLIMENSAGGGQKLGNTAKELGEIFHAVGSSRVKVCFDTAHAFEAGAIAVYDPPTITKTFDEWDKHIGLKNIVTIHTNDSKTTYNSNHDRHENLGEGYIGIDGFRALAAEKRLRDAAWILEVPGFDDNGSDLKNMAILKECFSAT